MVAAGHHRSDHELHRGHAGGDGAHQLRRHSLVAAADQHDAAHRLRSDHLFDVHRHQVAEDQARRGEEHFAKRDRRKLEREAAGEDLSGGDSHGDRPERSDRGDRGDRPPRDRGDSDGRCSVVRAGDGRQDRAEPRGLGDRRRRGR